ncbi:hypothetical protein ACSW8S_15955 (plasmid) [Clostridium perfringens]
MSGRKYIEDLVDDITKTPYGWSNNDEVRKKFWEKQRKEYGFDERETWDLDCTFIYWLYERLLMYKEYAGQAIRLDHHKFIIDGKEMTQIECINKMISNCKQIIVPTEKVLLSDDKIYNLKKETILIWSECFNCMWW